METPRFLHGMAWCVPGSPADDQPGLSGARSLARLLARSLTQSGAAASSGMHQAFK